MYSNLYSIPYIDISKIDEYVLFIEKCKRFKNLNYTESHHILPKSLFPEYEYDTNNLINLSPKNHYTAHLLLAKAYGGKMLYALNMISNRLRINCEEYETLKIEFSKNHSNFMKKLWKDADYIEKVNRNRNKKMQSDDYRKIHSDNQKERMKNPILRAKCGHRKPENLPVYKCWHCDITGRGKRFYNNHNKNCRKFKLKRNSIIKIMYIKYMIENDLIENNKITLTTDLYKAHIKSLFKPFED